MNNIYIHKRTFSRHRIASVESSAMMPVRPSFASSSLTTAETKEC